MEAALNFFSSAWAVLMGILVPAPATQPPGQPMPSMRQPFIFPGFCQGKDFFALAQSLRVFNAHRHFRIVFLQTFLYGFRHAPGHGVAPPCRCGVMGRMCLLLRFPDQSPWRQHPLEFLKGNYKIHIAADIRPGSLQLLGGAGADKDYMSVGMLFFNTSGRSHHRRQLLGNALNEIREVNLGQHGPGRTAGCQQERQFSGGHLFRVMMGFPSPLRYPLPEPPRIPRKIPVFKSAALNFPGVTFASELSDKGRGHPRQ